MKNLERHWKLRSGAKPHIWRHWRNHFESTKKATKLIEHVNV